MRISSRQLRIWMSFGVWVLALSGCSETADPVGPTGSTGLRSLELPASASAEHLTPAELQARGWSCFPPPVPNRVVCSRPNQGFPTVGDPPPADRPATFTFLVFDGAGQFAGTEVLIRTDLYHGQRCDSTGEPYVFVPVIGYYECVHTAGAVPSFGAAGHTEHQDLAALRQLTARFHDASAATAAGYVARVTPCLELPGVGGMGVHFGNPSFIDDPAVNLLEPELLLYEPQKDGSLRFVGVEYMIPFALLPATAPPPILLGHQMHPNMEAGLWGLHVWIGRENPRGTFEDWNPKVSCEFA